MFRQLRPKVYISRAMILFLLLLAAQVPGSLAYQPPAGWLRAVNPQTGLVTRDFERT